MKWFYNLKLSTKIGILSLQFIIFIMAIGLLGMVALQKENHSFKSLNDDRLIPIYDLEESKSKLMQIRLDVRSHLSTSNEAVRMLEEGDIKKNEEALMSLLDKYSRTYLVSEEVAGLEDFKKSFAEYKASMQNTIDLNNSGEYEKALENANGDAGAKFEKSIKAINKLIDIQIKVAQDLYKESTNTFYKTMAYFILVISVCIALGILLSILTANAVSRPVKKVTAKLMEISESGGDLRQRIGINSKDEVGRLSNAFDLFMDKLQLIIRDVTESAQVIAASSQQLSVATSETTKAMDQIAQAVNTVAGNTSDNISVVHDTTERLNKAAIFSETTASASKKTSDNSICVKNAADEGAKQVNGIVESMKSISGSSEVVAEAMNELSESSGRIGEIVQLITSVSEQTNLLALNAAIEAARAGEAGRGFNIVAEEIRKLADESNRSAKEIVMLVKDNQTKMEKSIRSVAEVEGMVALGVSKASEVKVNIDNIINNIKDIVGQITDIDKAVKMQADVTEGITVGMNTISANADDMAASTEEMSASIEEQVSTFEEIEATANQLAEMAEKLNSITSGFKV